MQDRASQTALDVLAANLEALRASHPVLNSQAEIARHSKVDQRTVNRIFRGEHQPGLDKISKIAKVFGLEPWQLLVPSLEPSNPPLLVTQSESMRKLYANLGRTKEAIEGVLRSEGNTRPGDL